MGQYHSNAYIEAAQAHPFWQDGIDGLKGSEIWQFDPDAKIERPELHPGHAVGPDTTHGKGCALCTKRRRQREILEQDICLFERASWRLMRKASLTPKQQRMHERFLAYSFNDFEVNTERCSYPFRPPLESERDCDSCEELERLCQERHEAASVAFHRLEGLTMFLSTLPPKSANTFATWRNKDRS
eukprot:GHVU01148272.1.p1 GENE.GHVU01148272.1~~GHVU01148272.1.p1  ORF type:complete len:186 (+),score=21.28 GHVU01148272.1:59-616(+)